MAIADGTEVLLPTSAEEATQLFGDGRGVTVVAGGTVMLPDIAVGRARPTRVLMLSRAALSGVRASNGSLTIGATTPIAELESGPEPLATVARHVADVEIRAQATVGGNLCAPPGLASQRGDLQAPLIAMGARVRSAGAGGERVEAVEDFLAGDEPRLVLEIDVEQPQRAATAGLGRRHSHSYTVLSVSCAETSDGVRVAVAGAGPRAVRLRGVEEAVAGGADSSSAAHRAADGLEPPDDALASSWYRRRTLPLLVREALDRLQGAS